MTTREQAEQVMREAQQLYRTMADALPVLVWQSGLDKLCTSFNKRWLEFTGRSLEQELGNGWAEGVHTDDLQYCMEVYLSCFDRREPSVMVYRLRHRAGEHRWVLDHGRHNSAPTEPS